MKTHSRRVWLHVIHTDQSPVWLHRLTPGIRRGEQRECSGRCSPSPACPCWAKYNVMLGACFWFSAWAPTMGQRTDQALEHQDVAGAPTRGRHSHAGLCVPTMSCVSHFPEPLGVFMFGAQ